MKFYHGTSEAHLKSILTEGIKCHTDKVWSPSFHAVYAWSPDAFVASGECQEEDKDTYTIGRASESAQCSMVANRDSGRLIIICFDIPEDDTHPDTSCDNMDGAVEICRDVLPSEFVSVQISNDLSLLRGYFIGLMLNNEYNGIEFTELEEKIGKAMQGLELYEIEDMIEWSPVELKKV